jgi:hypothetical protein
MADDWAHFDWGDASSPTPRALRERSILRDILAAIDNRRAEAWSDALLAEYGTLSAAISGRKRMTLPAVEGDGRAYALLRAVRRCQLDLAFAPIADRGKPVTGKMFADLL